ncbi:Vegetative incompatibility protein HET-E-1, partial [Hypsizygus marmoreus]
MPYFQNASNINIYGCTLNDFQENPATLARMNEYLDDEERQKVMSWISRMDFYAKQVDVARRREPGTCEWILNDAIFQSWESDSKGALWCRGIPGAGKTIAASLIVDHLCAFQLRQPLGTVGVAWVYYNYKDQSAQTPEAIYLGLIRQLAAFSIELYGLLESVIKKVYIVVDALDECASESRDNILDLLSRFQGCGANVLITSRDNVQESIDDSDLVNLRRMNIHGSTEDITTYVNARLENRLARIVRTRPSLKEEIVQKIVGLCNGMFLVATFHIESLRKAHNAGEVLESLKVLPKTIFGIYDDAMERIESHSDHARLALQILSFLTHARRPLSITELQHFLAVKPGHKEFHDEYVTDKDILVSICEGLIVIDDGTRIVRLVHLTAQEYFDRIRTSKFTEGDRDMGHACLIYLSFDVFRNPIHAPPQHYALLDYI